MPSKHLFLTSTNAPPSLEGEVFYDVLPPGTLKVGDRLTVHGSFTVDSPPFFTDDPVEVFNPSPAKTAKEVVEDMTAFGSTTLFLPQDSVDDFYRFSKALRRNLPSDVHPMSKFFQLLRADIPLRFEVRTVVDGVRRISLDGRDVAIVSEKDRTWSLLDKEGLARWQDGPEHFVWGGPYIERPWKQRLTGHLRDALLREWT